MPYIRLMILAILTPIFFYSSYEYTENGKFDYYNAVKDNKETMLDILYLSKELDENKDLHYCSKLKSNYKYTHSLYNNNFFDSVFANRMFIYKYKHYGDENNKHLYSHHNIDIYYNNFNDFSFCIRVEGGDNFYYNNYFEYLDSDLYVHNYHSCKGGYNLGNNRMFKIENNKFIYCE